MKFNFINIFAESITVERKNSAWVVVEGDAENAAIVENIEAQIPFEYYPTQWDYVNSVCTALGGVMMEPRGLFTPVEDEIY